MHNGQTVDPLNRYSKAIKSISSKRNKTEADYEDMARLEWEAGLYLKDGKIILPGILIEATIREGGKTKKLGKVVLGAVFCDADPELEFAESGETPDELWKDENHRLVAKVNIQRNSIMRTRPKFDEWSAEFELNYDETQIDEKTLLEIIEIGGTKGVGDWRPKFGRFQATAL